jgi:hypothetical protein
MFKHLIEKWDSYLSVLLGVFVLVAAQVTLSAKLMLWFKYYVFLMIGVVVFDTLKNFGEHENMMWKLFAILSNGLVLASCVILLEKIFNMTFVVKIVSLLPLFSVPHFMVYLGIFLVIENIMWLYVYDHF